jgi:hypothetical protein
VTAPLAPRVLVHRGSVDAAGLLVDPALVGAEQARRRALDVWSPGTRVFTLGPEFAVVWGQARRLRAEGAPGAWLVRQGRALSAVPLDPAELERVAPAVDTIVLARGGEFHIEPLGPEVDPAAWIDVETVQHETSSPLAARASFAVRVVEDPCAERVGEALRVNIGELPDGLLDASRALADLAAGRKPGAGPGKGESVRQRLLAAWSAFVAALATLFGSSGAGAMGSPAPRLPATSSRSLVVQRAAPPSGHEAWTTRLARALRNLAAQALLRLRLANFVGRQHAEYLAKMLDLFEQGDLENALRYAIPLRGEAGRDAQSALLPPRPRSALTLTAGSQKGSSIGLADDFYDDLRRRYRAAFETLDRAGDVERAAFVLAELLRATAEAVAYLEKHRRFALAAELAEARELAPEYVVRLWFRAGQSRRAIAVARRHGCFSLAVERLARDDAEGATALRLVWADACASAGDYLGAARVALGIAPAAVARWIDRAIEAGGATGAAACVMKLQTDPAAFPDVHARMGTILEDTTVLGQDARGAFLEALTASSAPGAKLLARAAVRAVLLGGATPKPIVDGLVDKAEDAALRMHATGPRTIGRPTLPSPPVFPIVHARGAGDGSGIPVRDAALVAHGRTLVALGELGVRLLGPDGRTLARFDAPASALVVSTHGDRVLAVMSRDEASPEPGRKIIEVARIDVIGRRVQRWGLLAADAFARTFDGATWYVARGGELLALDATTDDFEANWRIHAGGDAAPVRALELHVTDRRLIFVGTGQSGGQDVIEAYDLPSVTLRNRRFDTRGVAGLGALQEHQGRATYCGIFVQGGTPVGMLELCEARQPMKSVGIHLREGAWCVCGELSDGRVMVRMGTRDASASAEVAQCLLDAAADVRLGERAAVVFDGRGRVLVVDLRGGGVLQEMMVRV